MITIRNKLVYGWILLSCYLDQESLEPMEICKTQRQQKNMGYKDHKKN